MVEIKVIILIITAALIWKHWEWFKLASAVFVVITVLIALEIAFYIYYLVSTVFNHIRR